ncbi:Cytochrome P450 [Penicillium coprophilum]|uniref:Cytochrome P450 n=1 Tax=Penicillium coprophilum TaxID=36646 RepID=UPI002399A765|nr:Cytochrome P450 [Penicillium coprophilum]KAJ5158333.1 Cytochrome P450 [Penicillium coprophilum]
MRIVKTAYDHISELKQFIPDGHGHFGIGSFILFLSCACLIYIVVKAISRLYFHPLSDIPGPPLAAVSRWYDFYYNVIRDGTYSSQWPRLHKKYKSPVIRIGVNHVHVADESLYHEIYCSGTQYNKDPSFYKRLGLDGAILTITDPEQHRAYRNIINSLFSTRTTNEMGPIMAQEVQKVAEYMAKKGKENEPIIIQRVYRSVSADMVCELMFGKSLNLAETPDAYHDLMQSVDRFSAITWPKMHFPVINSVIAAFPGVLIDTILPGWLGYRKKLGGWYGESSDRCSMGKESDKRPTFYDLIVNAQSKADDLKFDRDLLVDDSLNYIIAGMDTTSYTLAYATYYILTLKDVKAKLCAELDEAAPFIRTSMDLRKIQQLPYLTAVIKEALRLSVAAPGGLPRLVPTQGMEIGETFVPGGTTVSLSHQVVQMSESIFPNPDKFIPERWLGKDGSSLEKWNIAFSKGPRQCIGMNLAYLEMYASIAYLFSRFEMALFETDESSIESFDRFAARTKDQVKVKVLSDRWEEN